MLLIWQSVVTDPPPGGEPDVTIYNGGTGAAMLGLRRSGWLKVRSTWRDDERGPVPGTLAPTRFEKMWRGDSLHRHGRALFEVRQAYLPTRCVPAGGAGGSTAGASTQLVLATAWHPEPDLFHNLPIPGTGNVPGGVQHLGFPVTRRGWRCPTCFAPATMCRQCWLQLRPASGRQAHPSRATSTRRWPRRRDKGARWRRNVPFGASRAG